MKRFTIVALSIIAIAGMAWAVSEKTDPDGSAFPHWFKAGLYVGGQTSNNPTVSTVNRIGDIRADFQSWDFPALTGRSSVSGATQLSTETSVSGTFTKAGLRFGDTCIVGIDQTPASPYFRVEAFVTAANAYNLRLSVVGISDAGVVDLPDSGYTTRCFGTNVR